MNTNVLAGLKCPKCDSYGPYIIETLCWAEVHDDGIEQTTAHEWKDSSGCECCNCHFKGRVKNFEPKRMKNSGNPKGNPKGGEKRG